jgi:hypothetical protein
MRIRTVFGRSIFVKNERPSSFAVLRLMISSIFVARASICGSGTRARRRWAGPDRRTRCPVSRGRDGLSPRACPASPVGPSPRLRGLGRGIVARSPPCLSGGSRLLLVGCHVLPTLVIAHLVSLPRGPECNAVATRHPRRFRDYRLCSRVIANSAARNPNAASPAHTPCHIKTPTTVASAPASKMSTMAVSSSIAILPLAAPADRGKLWAKVRNLPMRPPEREQQKKFQPQT